MIDQCFMTLGAVGPIIRHIQPFLLDCRWTRPGICAGLGWCCLHETGRNRGL